MTIKRYGVPEGNCLLCGRGTFHHSPNCPTEIWNRSIPRKKFETNARRVIWTPEMDETLRELHPKMGIRRLAKKIGVYPPAVRVRRDQLGLAPKPTGANSIYEIRNGWKRSTRKSRKSAQRPV